MGDFVDLINIRKSTPTMKMETSIRHDRWKRMEKKLTSNGWVLKDRVKSIEEKDVESIDDVIINVDNDETEKSQDFNMKVLKNMDIKDLRDLCDQYNIEYSEKNKEQTLIKKLMKLKDE